MDPEAVETVVIAETVLEPCRTPEADDPGGETDDQGAGEIDEARSRGYGDEAGHGARDAPQDARLGAQPPFDGEPAHCRGGCGNVGDGERHAGTRACGQRRAGVEAEPANPKEACADDAQDEIVRQEGLDGIALTPADDDG